VTAAGAPAAVREEAMDTWPATAVRSSARVRWRRAGAQPRAVVLVLHGGQEDGLQPPGRWTPARLRMLPFVSALARATRGRGVAVGEVVYRCEGWNGGRADAAVDAVAAVEEVAADWGPVPVVLVGHSMGGRAALRAAGGPAVTGVVALAPWCPPGEPCTQLAGRRLAVVHGSADRVTEPAASRRIAREARAAGAEVCVLTLPGGRHGMLERAADWHAVTTRLATGLLGLTPLPGEVCDAFDRRGTDPGGLDLLLPRRRAL